MADKIPMAMAPFGGGALIPRALRREKRWAPWVTQWLPKARGGAGKWDKRPGLGKSTARPETWMTFEDALAAYQGNPKLFAGIGFVTTGQAVVVGVDLDHCVVNGVIAPWAQEVVAQLASYTEVSPSGTGLRIMVTGHVPNDWNNHEVGIEVYGGNTSRFLTITGSHLPGTPLDVCAAPAGNLEGLEKRYAKERAKADVIDISMPDIIDDALLPSIENLDLPYKAKDFLLDGTFAGADRSDTLFSTAVALCTTGISDAEVFSILVNNEHSMGLALDKRHQDYDKALAYLWREDVCKGRAKAVPRITADEFDVIESDAQGAPLVRDLSVVKAKRFQVLSAFEFAKRVPQRWIIKGILPAAGLCVVYGDSGSGKTFFALDLVGSVARGVEWRGKKVRKGRIVYLCAEGAGGFRDRMEAYAAHHGLDLADFEVGVIPDSPNLLEKLDVKDLIAALAAFGPFDMLVIDTLAQSMPGGNENAGDDMGRVLAHCKAIHKATNALIMLIHHSGKDAARGARGWSGLRGAADVQIEIVRAGDDRAAVIDKQKDGGGEGDEYGFKLATVTIGQDDEGDDITSCVLLHVESAPKSERKKEPKGDKQKIVLKTVRDLVDIGDDRVNASTLIEAAVNQIPKDEAAKCDNRRRDVLRAIESLIAANQIAVTDGLVELR